MSSKKVFHIRDKVFAKIRGYPAWPAIISGVKADTPSRMRYNVYFYGTGERAECKPDELFPYEENKFKLGKPSKRKYFAEALIQIEDDQTGFSVLPEQSNPVIVPSSNTVSSNTEQESPKPLDESENEKVGESNSETEGKLTIDETSTPKGKKISTSKKSLGISISKGTKRKLSEVKLDTSSKRSMQNKIKMQEIGEIMKNKDNAVVKMEPLNPSLLEKVIAKQNLVTPVKNVTSQPPRTPDTTNKSLESSNTTEPIPESSDESLPLDNGKTPKSSSKIKNSPSVVEISANNSSVGHVSRSGRKIKPKKYSDYENDGEVPKRSRLSKENVKTSEKVVNSETDNSIELNHNTKDTNSNTEIIKTSKNHTAGPVLQIHDSSSKEMNQVSKKISEDNELPSGLKSLMTNAITNIESDWNKTVPIKRSKVEILHTEVCLLDCIHKLRLALRTDHANCETALKLLEQLNGLELINAFMLTKHKEVVDTIKKVSKYVGNASEWDLNQQETIKHIEKAKQVRCKADAVFNKFVSLFIVPDGKTFQDVFNKEVEDFNLKTKNLACDQIYGLTSDI